MCQAGSGVRRDRRRRPVDAAGPAPRGQQTAQVRGHCAVAASSAGEPAVPVVSLGVSVQSTPEPPWPAISADMTCGCCLQDRSAVSYI